MALESIDIKPGELSAEQEQEFLRIAPITEVAEYLNIDIGLAVQMRIDEAVSTTYDKIAARQGPIAEDIYREWAKEQSLTAMDITVRPIELQGNLHGFASITIGGIRVDDFKIVESKSGELFVGMPSKPDKSSSTGYRNTVHIDKSFRDDFNSAVIGAFYSTIEQESSQNAPVMTKPRISDQVAKAAREAERHNAAIPVQAREKSIQKRGDRE